MKTVWTEKQIPDLSGMRVVVTGGGSGLGFEAVRIFASRGAEVIVACRDRAKSETAVKRIQHEYSEGRVLLMDLDLADLRSINDFADEFTRRFESLDILLNNAGIMAAPFSLTRDGFETQFGTNYLGHFALTARLIGILKRTPYSRIVNVCSGTHRIATLDPADLMCMDRSVYHPITEYCRSKIASLIFSCELQRRFDRYGWNSKSLAAHPGVAKTEIGRHLQKRFYGKILLNGLKPLVRDASQGVLPAIRAAVDPSLSGGEYLGPGGFAQMTGPPSKVNAGTLSKNRKLASELWRNSEDLVGMSFDFS